MTSSPQLQALLQTSGVAPLETLGWVRVTGDDRARWLNGMLTNSIQDLQPGAGCFNFFLSAQGRIQGTLTVFARPDHLLLETDGGQLSALIPALDHFIIMDDVELADITGERTGLALIGPQAPALLAQLGLPVPSTMSLEDAAFQGAPLAVIAAHSPLVPRFELWSDATTISAVEATLTAAGALAVSPEPLEWLRLLEGTPRYDIDIRAKELPQETNQTHALHFHKGCYLGQEIVERIRSRGAVHRTFGAFRLEGPLPTPNTSIESEGKAVGEITSVASIPSAFGFTQIALGYIRREALERNTPLICGQATVHPVPLPIHQL